MYEVDESIDVSTLVVFVWSILLACVPLALRGGGGIKGFSVLYVSLPPPMNQTMANEAFLDGIKPGVTAFEIGNRFWAHVICVAAGLEALLLWAQVRKMRDSKPFTYTNVVNTGGLYTANTEFWFYVGMHHTVFIMLLLSPMSFHSLLLFVYVGVGAIYAMCQPSEDHEEDNSHSEVYLNRVSSTFFLIFIFGILVAVDARMNQPSLGYIPVMRVNLLLTQFFIDVMLTIVHVSIHVDILTCYYARLVYTYVCGGLVVSFLACA